jgi:hypothetical protein
MELVIHSQNMPESFVQSTSCFLKLGGTRKWEKAKLKGGACYEASTVFMARDMSEKCQPKVHLPVGHQEMAPPF